MHVEHTDGRTIMDTLALAAVTGRSRWAIRTTCTRQAGGYDVDACAAALERVSDPVLLTASEAERYLGVQASTVRKWASRGRLVSHDRDRLGRVLYDSADLIRLRG